eukprot:10295212-Heterocapsa_arctica.AAC.1
MLKIPWPNLDVHATSGVSHDTCIEQVKAIIAKNATIMTVDTDGISKMPADVHCIVFDNLNAIYTKDVYTGMPVEEWHQ